MWMNGCENFPEPLKEDVKLWLIASDYRNVQDFSTITASQRPCSESKALAAFLSKQL